MAIENINGCIGCGTCIITCPTDVIRLNAVTNKAEIKYPAGDALGSYMVGVIYTQVGSSLAGSAVQGAVAGEAAAEYSKTIRSVNISAAKIGEVKKENLMKAALAYVEELRDHHIPLLRAADLHELRLAHETANMIITAEMKLKASIMRTESRCSHYRLDYPDMDDKNWRAWIIYIKEQMGLCSSKNNFLTVGPRQKCLVFNNNLFKDEKSLTIEFYFD